VGHTADHVVALSAGRLADRRATPLISIRRTVVHIRLLRGVLVRAAAKALAATVGVAWIVTVINLGARPASIWHGPSGHAGGNAAAAAPPIQRLVTRHDCWTSAADMPSRWRARLPGHVIVATARGGPRWSADLVGAALDHVFKERHRRMRVYAFCR
jgi:hypothetical protein